MKKLVVNAALCDTRSVTEETLNSYESVAINAAAVITSQSSKELMARYPVTMNTASVIEVPERQDIEVRTVNGKYEIAPETDGKGVVLIINGKLTVQDGSIEALKSFEKIFVNGKSLMPRSCMGQTPNIEQNGKTEYFPDGAFVLKEDTAVDSLFIARAAKQSYYCSGTLLFLETGIDMQRIEEKGLRFSGRRAVVAESLLDALIPHMDEETKIVRVPDGTVFVDGDLDLKPRTVRRYGTRLFVDGDVTISDREALSEMEYLYADGDVIVDAELEEDFYRIESEYSELIIRDHEKEYISDRPSVRIGASMLKTFRKGVEIIDCARVTLSKEISPEEILEKIRIKDCAVVFCSEEQEDAVNMVASDIAAVRTGDDGGEESLLGGFLKLMKDAKVVNAVEYKL